MADGQMGPDRASGGADGAPLAALERRLAADVGELTRHGERVPGGRGHATVRDYLTARLRHLGVATYTGEGLVAPFGSTFSNVLALVQGADRHRRPVVLATNYDSQRGTPGASENAAAVALVLALIPRLASAALDRGVVVAMLDGAAPPRHPDAATGATVLLTDQRRHDVKAAVVLDRIGHVHGGCVPAGTVLVTGVETDARLPRVLAAGEGEGIRLAPVHRRYRRDVPLSAPFRDEGVPYLELFGGRWSGHGTSEDTADRLDCAHLARLVGVVEALVRALDSARLPGPFEGYDSSEYEAEALSSVVERAAWPAPQGADGRRRVDGAVTALGSLLG